MLRAGRLKDAASYALRYNVQFDENVQASLAKAREYWAGKENRDGGIGRSLNDAEKARRLAALKDAQKSK